jgi:two-component system LytT family response regulator
MIRCLIVEDEVAGQELLLKKLKDHFPDLQVVQVIADFDVAIEYLKNNPVDLLFLDNMIRGGLGIDVIKQIPDLSAEVIFCTAYAEFAVEALNRNATYYLLKPYSDAELISAIEKAIQRIGQRTNTLKLIKTNPENILISDILFLRSKGAYCEFVLSDQRTILTSKNIGYYEKRLPIDQFYRIHHSYLIQLSKIESVTKGDQYQAKLKGYDTWLPISTRRASKFLEQVKS